MEDKSLKLVAAVDFGTGGGRCTVYTVDGCMVGKAYEAWTYDQPDPQDAETRQFDAAEVWDRFIVLIRAALEEALDATGCQPSDVLAISTTSQREGIVLLDEYGNELYAGPNMDHRGRDYNALLAQRLGPEIYDKSGHWPGSIFAVGRLLWFKDRDPQLYKRISALLSINDWLVFKLSGQRCSEPTNATETLMYSLQSGCWDTGICDSCGVEATLLQPLFPAGTVLGHIPPDISRITGLSEKTLVVIGGADTQCALLGSGVVRPGEACVVAGSTTPIQLVTEKPLIDSKRRTWTCPHVYPGYYVLEANAGVTGLVFRWLHRSFYPEVPEGNASEVMLREASGIVPGMKGPFAFMGPSVCNMSEKRPQITVLTGLNLDYAVSSGRAQLVRAYMENMAYAVRANIELVCEIAGLPQAPVVITGGGASHPLLPLLIAAVMGRDLEVTPNAETASLGAAICAAVGAGVYPGFRQAAAAMVPENNTISIKKDGQLIGLNGKNPYPDLYRKWLRLYHQAYLPVQNNGINGGSNNG